MTGKPTTRQAYYESINKVIDYINNHLGENLTLEFLSSHGNFSPFHFHRIMKAYLGESLYAYILRLRMEFAATLLLHTEQSVSDIAYKVGYDTPAAFTTAFKKRFGFTPGECKTGNPFLHYNINPKTQFMKKLEPKIKELKPTKVIYVSAMGAYNKSAEEAWEKVCQFASQKKLWGFSTEFIGISHDDPKITEAGKLRYDACIKVSKDVKPEGEMGVKTIEGGKYAIFLHKGPYEEFETVYDYIYSQWLPESGCELRDLPCLERYLNDPKKSKPENLKTEILIPIR